MSLKNRAEFTGRRDLLAAYDAMWIDPVPYQHLLVEGMGGNGKSTVLEYLHDYHAPDKKQIPLLIDFAGTQVSQTEYGILDEFARELRPHLPPTAFKAYKAEARKADAAIEEILKLAQSLHIEQKASLGGTVQNSPISVQVNAELNQRLMAQRQRNRRQMLAIFLEALEPLAERQIVLLFDTWERLLEAGDKDLALWLCDSVLPELLVYLPHCRVVLVGRERLPELKRHYKLPLLEWDTAETLSYLQIKGMPHDELLLNAIHQHCQGQPLLVSMAFDVWQANPQALLAADLLQSVNREAALRWLYARLLDQLPSKFKVAAESIALLHQFDANVLAALAAEPLTDTEFRQLLQYAFIRPLPAQMAWQVHDLVRQTFDAWQRQQHRQAYQAFHSKAANYYAELSQGWFYHQFAQEDTEAIFALWQEQVEGFRQQLAWQPQTALLSMLAMPERWSYLNSEQKAWHQWFEGYTAYFKDAYALASGHYQRAAVHFREAESVIGEANTLKSLGDLYLRFAKLSEAEASYRRALGLFKGIGDRLGEANTLQSLGDLYLRLAKLSEAEGSYRGALGMFKSIGARLGEANTLQSLARFYYKAAQTETAEQYYQQALSLYAAISDVYSTAATYVYRAMDRLHQQQSTGFADWGQALQLAFTVDEYLFRQVLGMWWRSLVALSEHKAFLLQGLPSFEQALPLSEEDLSTEWSEVQRLLVQLSQFLSAFCQCETEQDKQALIQQALALDKVTGGRFNLQALLNV